MLSTAPAASPGSTVLRLPRVLSVWDLVLYGIMAVTPSAPVTVFGIAMVASLGHALDTILIAMVAMVLTAVSYGRMAALYPSAGSAYTYVGKGLNPYLGFLAGWAMLLDYLFIPLFCVIYGTLSFRRMVPEIPYVVSTIFFAGFMTIANLRGIRTTARTSAIIVAGMGLVLLTFIGLAIRFLLDGGGAGTVTSSLPFYNPATFAWDKVAQATSFAALTYLGFDSVTTLAEDVKNPKRSVMLAAVLVCVFTGIFGGFLVYLATLVWPDYETFQNVETAFMDVTQRVGGSGLFNAMAILLVVANLGAGLTSQVGAARLLFGMGRDRVFPPRFFAHLSSERKTPTYNILLVGGLALIGAQFMTVELTGELLNFGAFLGFMGVNLAAIWQFFIRKQIGRSRNILTDLVVPGVGFLFCFGIWINLSAVAQKAGGVWFLIGVIYLAIRTKGFREKPASIDFSGL
jgi:putrescine importer